MALPLIVCGYILILPESPRYVITRAVCRTYTKYRRWLLQRGYRGQKSSYAKAFDSLCLLRRSRLLAARDMFLIYHQLKAEREIQLHHNRFFELFSKPRNRRALTASVVTVFMQQFCGVNVLLAIFR